MIQSSFTIFENLDFFEVKRNFIFSRRTTSTEHIYIICRAVHKQSIDIKNNAIDEVEQKLES